MNKRKIYTILLILLTLFIFSACDNFLDNSKDLADLEAENADLNTRIAELNLLVGTLENGINDLNSTISNLELENEELETKVKEYIISLSTLENQADILTDYEQQITTLENQILSLNNQISLNNTTITSLTNTKTELEVELSAVQLQKTSLALEIVELEEENTELTEKLDNIFQLVNDVSYIAMKANVKIRVEHTNMMGGGIASLGSGVIFYENETNYYLLTNNHVVFDEPDYSKIKYIIYDYLGNEYSGSLVFADPDYDLALIYFEKGEVKLLALPFAETNPEVQTTVISMGQPKGQLNTISLGEVLKYQKIDLDKPKNFSNVTFDVIMHNSPINTGSSGGALLDSNLEIIGVNYAGASVSKGVSEYSYAIPIIKVKECLLNHNFIMN